MRYSGLPRVLGIAALLVPSGSARADVTLFSTTATYPTLAEALAAAPVGDTLALAPGDYVERVVISRDVTLVLLEPGIVSLATPDGAGPVIEVAPGVTVTIDGLAFASAPAITATSATLTLSNVVFQGASTGDGGGLALTDSSATLEDCAFVGTSTDGSGGALSATRGSLALDDVTFTDTSAGLDGGALHLVDAAVTCEGCVFVATTAARLGGAVDQVGGTFASTGSTWTDGTAAKGGALHAEGGAVTLNGDDFTGNFAITNGGALSIVDAALTVSGGAFCDNWATFGGAIRAEGTGGTLSNAVFGGNDAGQDGDAMQLTEGPWDLGQLSFLANGLESDGSALHLDAASVSVVGALFAWNAGLAIDNVATDPYVAYSAFYANTGTIASGSLDEGIVLDLDPALPGFSDDGDCGNDDPWPSPTSPLVDAGDPAVEDPDGSRADIGATGGPGADPVPHGVDLDGDGAAAPRDCDESDPTVSRDAAETCDDRDEDCDGAVDESDALDAIRWHPDLDLDGYGDGDDAGTLACEAPPGRVADGRDCDDRRMDIHPGAAETCDVLDRDCDGSAIAGAPDAATWYADDDADGYGEDATAMTACAPPGLGWVQIGGDCADLDPLVNPGSVELCNGLDDNCSGDETDAPAGRLWYRDADGDGAGDDADFEVACGAPPGRTDRPGDCDDREPGVHPGALEICDGLDNDCDGVSDSGPTRSWWPDDDGDGFGGLGDPLVAACAPSADWVLVDGDCADLDAARHPSAPEVCNDLDDDCDGAVDTEDPGVIGVRRVYVDQDGDGWGVGEPSPTCAPEGGAAFGGDCDDGAATVHPGAEEIVGDDLDDDCDGGAPKTAWVSRGAAGCDVTGGAAAPPSVVLMGLLALWRRRCATR